MGKGVAHATGTAERDPTELVSAVQPDARRPTGACNTTHIMTPSRIRAAEDGRLLNNFEMTTPRQRGCCKRQLTVRVAPRMVGLLGL